MGVHVMPGMFSLLAKTFDSIVFPVPTLLYRLPGEEWHDSGGFLSSLGSAAGQPEKSLKDFFITESTGAAA